MRKITRRQALELLRNTAVISPFMSALIGCGVEGEEQGLKNLGLSYSDELPLLPEGDEPWFMRGNYAPLARDGVYVEGLEVIGKLPPELSA